MARERRDGVGRGGDGWEEIEVSPGHFIESKPLDPEILKQMPPPGSKPFIQVGLVEFTVREIKKLLSPSR